MRLWTIHPRYLDAKGLVAAWREGLLAQKVLQGGTRGYKQHPQLIRFQAHEKPVHAVTFFLRGLADEAVKRKYNFDATKIFRARFTGQLDETEGQLLYEWRHLLAKLEVRAPHVFQQFKNIKRPEPHPLFRIIPGGIRDWEKT